jgi:predicted membrane-bound mannosyltransferase
MSLSTPASTALGTVTANEWSDYMQHFVPYENQLIQYAQDPNRPQKDMQTALGIQQAGNAQEPGIEQRQLAQYDTKLTAEEQTESNKQRGLNDALANVTAQNKAKDTAVANQMGIMGTPMTGITGQL